MAVSEALGGGSVDRGFIAPATGSEAVAARPEATAPTELSRQELSESLQGLTRSVWEKTATVLTGLGLAATELPKVFKNYQQSKELEFRRDVLELPEVDLALERGLSMERLRALLVEQQSENDPQRLAAIVRAKNDELELMRAVDQVESERRGQRSVMQQMISEGAANDGR